MQAVATRLLGEPNKAHSNPTQMRFGNHGSLSIDLEKGVYHDHEAGEGGGVLDLIITNVPSVKSSLEARKWIEQEIGFDSAPPPVANGALNIKRPSVRTEVGRYEYLNADKTLAYTVVKYEQNGRKTYRPFLPGNDHPGLGDVKKIPYRLPELLAADLEQPVYICEGEKDVDRLMAEGLLATCNSGGAANW